MSEALYTRRRNKMPWNRSYRGLWAAMWVLRNKLRSAGRSASADIHSWAIPRVTRTPLYINPVFLPFWTAGTKWFHSNNDSCLPLPLSSLAEHITVLPLWLGLVFWPFETKMRLFRIGWIPYWGVGIPKRERASKTTFLTRSRRASGWFYLEFVHKILRLLRLGRKYSPFLFLCVLGKFLYLQRHLYLFFDRL